MINILISEVVCPKVQVVASHGTQQIGITRRTSNIEGSPMALCYDLMRTNRLPILESLFVRLPFQQMLN